MPGAGVLPEHVLRLRGARREDAPHVRRPRQRPDPCANGDRERERGSDSARRTPASAPIDSAASGAHRASRRHANTGSAVPSRRRATRLTKMPGSRAWLRIIRFWSSARMRCLRARPGVYDRPGTPRPRDRCLQSSQTGR